jgi:hypothetical protein
LTGLSEKVSLNSHESWQIFGVPIMGNFHLELIIPGLPSSGNGKLGDHHFVQWEENKEWHRLVHLHVLKKGAPLKPLNRCELKLVRHGSVPLDYDNLVISFKSIVDGLVEAKVIADDSFAVTGPWEVSQVKVPRKNTCVSIQVWELPYDGPDIQPRRNSRKTIKKTFKRSFSRRRR